MSQGFRDFNTWSLGPINLGLGPSIMVESERLTKDAHIMAERRVGRKK